ncbi:hypothetical protein PTQ19_03950 [Microbacterium esteraromaticum]|uniref:DUF6882 domain-containing protein n=1 Tax=Microbacterium esteraromaticum TaxID=57043 RepID=UPI0023678ED1|nr:DUF6882 domain-containing protein [Microbacterium esteraromaticum]WDH79608.1 hypothetical protein PTQ19_03950 [Microbacterium esteraromaticum]
MNFDTLRALADRAALFTALRQDQLVAAVDDLGEHRWSVDLSAGVFTFAADADPSRTLQATPHLIASIAPGPRSLMWSWALPESYDTTVADRLRTYGEQHGIAELTAGEVALPDGDDGDSVLSSVAHLVGGAAVEITGLSPYYIANVGDTRAVILLDAAVPTLSVSTAVQALPRVLAGLTMRDPRASVWDLSRLAGWRLEWADESFSAAVVSDATGTATFRFDEHARISGIESTLTGA